MHYCVVVILVAPQVRIYCVVIWGAPDYAKTSGGGPRDGLLLLRLTPVVAANSH